MPAPSSCRGGRSGMLFVGGGEPLCWRERAQPFQRKGVLVILPQAPTPPQRALFRRIGAAETQKFCLRQPSPGNATTFFRKLTEQKSPPNRRAFLFRTRTVRPIKILSALWRERQEQKGSFGRRAAKGKRRRPRNVTLSRKKRVGGRMGGLGGRKHPCAPAKGVSFPPEHDSPQRTKLTF